MLKRVIGELLIRLIDYLFPDAVNQDSYVIHLAPKVKCQTNYIATRVQNPRVAGKIVSFFIIALNH